MSNLGARRAIVLVIDGCGIGAAPDHERFGDSADCNTIANTARELGGLSLPNLAAMGLGNITNIAGVTPAQQACGFLASLRKKATAKILRQAIGR